MATKNYICLLSKNNENDFISNNDNQFSNLNLNQSYRSSDAQLVSSKTKSSQNKKSPNNGKKKTAVSLGKNLFFYEGKYNCIERENYGVDDRNFPETAAFIDLSVLNTFNEASQKSCHSLNKKDSHLIPSEYLKNSWKEKNQRKEKDDLNKSTLSLHISAYENITVTDNLVDQDKSSLNKFSSSKLSSEKFKSQFVGGLANSIFEVPRQQKGDESTEPEIMQLKASQKLIHPNRENRLESENKNDVGKSDFEKLKDKANTLFQEEKYNESIKIYSDILQLSDLTLENKAVIYSNRSASYLLLGNSLNSAKIDAEKAIKCWPNWWKGYYRLARVSVFQKEWEKAEKSVKLALMLNPESKLVQEELYGVRNKQTVKAFLRNPITSEEVKKNIFDRFSLSEKELEDPEKLSHRLAESEASLVRGYQLKFGIFVDKNYKESVEFFTKSANLGNTEAMYELGKAYFFGEKGLKQDYGESVTWFLKAANSNPTSDTRCNSDAETFHGKLCLFGIGVNKDCRKAAEWFKKAVKTGNSESANNLGELYMHGCGVEKSSLKAFYHFKMGAEDGNTRAMVNISKCYFFADGTELKVPIQEYVDEGKKWLQIAVGKDDGENIEEIRRLSQDLTPESAFTLKLKNAFIDEQDVECSPLDSEQFGECVAEAAKNGSVTAQEHMEIWKYMNEALEAFKKNDSAKLIKAFAKAISLHHEIIDIPVFYKQVIEESFDPDDRDSAVCFIKMERDRGKWPEHILTASKLFPDDEYFAEMTFHYYRLFVKDQKAASDHVQAFLSRHPDSLRLLYCRILNAGERKSVEIIKVADEFIAAAPEDNPYIPSCHYNKALYYGLIEDMKKSTECYKVGLSAEKKQLPCFLPYYFDGKGLMEMSLIKELMDYDVAVKEFRAYHESRRKFDPKRNYLIIKNREHFKTYVDGYGTSKFVPPVVSIPLRTSDTPSWSTLKKIALNDMDPTKEKVYKGCILKAQIIDWAIFDKCIHTVIEDKNGDVLSLTVANWSKFGERNFDMLELIKAFRPNSTILIANPFYRISNTGKKDIFVEDLRYVKFDASLIDKLCHVCGKEAKTLQTCSTCNMAIYCSNECEELDQTEFDHEKICENLKMFKTQKAEKSNCLLI